jgi:HEAT repeat protein
MTLNSGTEPKPPDWLTHRRRLDAILRLQAAVLAGDPTQNEAIQLLGEALGDPLADIREAAAGALAEIGRLARPALPEIVRATQDESPLVRRRSLRAVGMIADAEEVCDGVLETLIAATEDEDAGVALQALAELANLGPHAVSALPALVSAMWTGDVRRRAFAGVALARIGAAAVPSVIQLLSHPSADVRTKAAHVLGKIGPEAAAAASALTVALGDRDETARREAEMALGLIGAK